MHVRKTKEGFFFLLCFTGKGKGNKKKAGSGRKNKVLTIPSIVSGTKKFQIFTCILFVVRVSFIFTKK
jgi:hypothetical protein